MTYATLLVNLQVGVSNEPLLATASQFAGRFKAHVIGIAACQPMIAVGGNGMVCGDVFENDQRQIAINLHRAHDEFLAAFERCGSSLEWRSEITLEAPAHYLSINARSADLIVTTSMATDSSSLSQTTNLGSLVLEAGRPVLVVPPVPYPIRFDRAMVAWKDSREGRRAVIDALPLLKQIDQVLVVEVAARDDLDAARLRVADVATWLGRHGVSAVSRVERTTGDDTKQLRAAADTCDADFIVAGAYGHGRLREWVVGGVTRDLLLTANRATLVSH